MPTNADLGIPPDVAWWFNEAVSLLREARLHVAAATSLAEEIDESLPSIQTALVNAVSGRLVQVGWWVLDEFRPEDMTESQWETERLTSLAVTAQEGGLAPNWVDRVRPVFVRTLPPNDGSGTP
jgi:hypothetical protein